jgi:hypothetical protein
MAIPLSPKLSWELANPLWAQVLNPVITNLLNGIQVLQNVALINGATVVNHRLGKQMQGWFIVDMDSAAIVYRSAPLNDKTITLTSNAAVNVNLAVF